MKHLHLFDNSKHWSRILILSAWVITGFSCTKPESSTDVHSEINISAESQTTFTSGIVFEASESGLPLHEKLSFSTNGFWKAQFTETQASDWLAVQPNTGSAGLATITIIAQPNTLSSSRSAVLVITSGEASKSCSIKQNGHKDTYVAVEGISLNEELISLNKGDKIKLVATIKPDNATNKTISWSSSNTSVATINGDGEITALAGGNATIYAKAGEVSASCQVTVTVAVESITLDKVSITLSEEQTTVITATVNPSDASDKTVAWSSSNSSVASVDQNGQVTAVAEGTATITAKAGGKSATCSVSVQKKIVPVTSISLNKASINLNKGQGETLIATVKPDNATDKTVSWSSSDNAIATVDQYGKVTAVAGGSATIYAKAGEVSASCQVTVTVAVESITLSLSSANVFIGDTITIEAHISPDNATNKTIIWTSDNANVANVVNGVVTGISVGSTIIRAISENGLIQANCSIVVKEKSGIDIGVEDWGNGEDLGGDAD